MVKGSVDNRTYRCKRTKNGNAVETEEEKLLVLEGSSDIDLIINV